MTTEPNDPDLHARFCALREHDLASVPGFDTVWARAAARARPTGQFAVPMRAVAAVAGIAAVTLTLWLIVSPRPAPPNLDAVALPGWRTPSDTLLAGAGDPFHSPSWATLPTAGLGQPFFNRPLETR
jgi:hypothetical protein